MTCLRNQKYISERRAEPFLRFLKSMPINDSGGAKRTAEGRASDDKGGCFQVSIYIFGPRNLKSERAGAYFLCHGQINTGNAGTAMCSTTTRTVEEHDVRG